MKTMLFLSLWAGLNGAVNNNHDLKQVFELLFQHEKVIELIDKYAQDDKLTIVSNGHLVHDTGLISSYPLEFNSTDKILRKSDKVYFLVERLSMKDDKIKLAFQYSDAYVKFVCTKESEKWDIRLLRIEDNKRTYLDFSF